jgi:hypothetical protein
VKRSKDRRGRIGIAKNKVKEGKKDRGINMNRKRSGRNER